MAKGLERPKVFIFLAADYGNLGDVAITYAQHKFLQNCYPNHLVTEIPISKTLDGIAFVKKTRTSKDIMTIVGGGNMGDLYPMIEHFRQLVIQNFPENRIICFPQTVDFSETPKGQKALKKAIRVYSKHPDLTLLAREKKSHQFFKEHFPKNKSLLSPDIVMGLDRSESKFGRKGALICLREDKEKKRTQHEEQVLLEIVDSYFGNHINRDTHIGGRGYPLIARVRALFRIWEDFKKAELVVTDRLHGMIFCYITRTPALVFLNNNHKVKSCHAWIQDAHWISLLENWDSENIKKAIQSVTSDNSSFTGTSVQNKFQELTRNLRES
ncbi:putative pyruvyl transferase EpsI [Muriicola marianensis]|uniref:Pyruvyl transferase EpsI n=2 Tax=Muriicola marianensis TaxID=1324801 RepID=A0ABQ1QQI3_9FLAO|nr:putative pyruvyl transferase EpsI [Muriicola marianensis]